MGKQLFESSKLFEALEREIDRIAGFSIRDMCLHGTDEELRRTDFTQPCLYMVNALCYEKCVLAGRSPSYFAGHSLGEYNALQAAGAFDLLSGLRMVVRRGELMAAAPKGAMAAVLGITADKVARGLEREGLRGIDLANFNTPSQVVISGPADDLYKAEPAMMAAGASAYVRLQVGCAFHSRYMESAAEDFDSFLREIPFRSLRKPVISNVTARPYPVDDDPDLAIRPLLVRQLKSQVLWSPSISYLKANGVTEFTELGPGTALTRMIAQIPETDRAA